MRGAERGVALLEVLVAVTIFATAALGVVQLLAEAADHERRAEAVEQRLADQERLMAAYSLLTRNDLDRRLGARWVGAYMVEVHRPHPALYRVTVAADSVSTPDLATLVYRPEPSR